MRSKKTIITCLLLLFVSLTIAAEDSIRIRPCRSGVILPTMRSQRAQEPPLEPGGDFYHGDRRQLVVLAAFRDQPFQGDVATSLAKWDNIFNAEDYHEGSFVGSVHDYFYAQSYGMLNLTFDLIYVDLPGSLMKYHSTSSHDENSQYLVDDIVDVLQTQDIDWNVYDWNGDGYVNQLLIVYAGKGQNADGGSNTIWPHQWWLSKHLKNIENKQEGYRGYRTVTTGDKQFIIDSYCCVQETTNTTNVKTSFGTICHEYSHCFGFPDFYYDQSTRTVGEWDLMDFGNYGDSGFRPCGYSAHERWLMGWLTPIELDGENSISNMPALEDEGRAYLICNDGWENEYYIVENRQKMGWDASLPGSGILIFHIDYDPSAWMSIEETPNTSLRRHYELFHANNSSSYKNWAYPYRGNNSLTDTSLPAAKLWHARNDSIFLMSKPLTNMAVDSDGLASFDFMKDASTIQAIKSISVVNEQWLDLQGCQLSGRPQRKGLYIVNGRKMFVR